MTRRFGAATLAAQPHSQRRVETDKTGNVASLCWSARCELGFAKTYNIDI
jgi:hypothetical protein